MRFLQLLRVKHWVKNFFLFLPLFFAGKLFTTDLYADLSLGFLSFSLIASAIYIINDYRDIEADKIHPKKSKRPLASGLIPKPTAIVVLIICVVAGFALAYYVKPKFMFITLIYFVINLSYSFGLKNFPILDILIVALGFNLRVKAGGVIAGIAVSEWLTVMIFLLSLFLAVAKRRDDLLIKVSSGMDMRKSVKGYNLDYINGVMYILSAVILVAYLMYTLSPEVKRNFGTYRLYYTLLFVIAGVFRYLQIALVENNTGSPTGVLYKDRFIQACLVLWLLSFYFIIYYPDVQIFLD